MSDAAQRYLNRLGAGVEDLFHHVLAVLHDPSCREANARALRMEWPLIPLPGWPDGDEDGSVMPGQGRVVKRTHTTDEQSALGNATARIGETKFDIYLNDRACWRIAFSQDIRDNISVMRYSAVPNTGVNTDPVESAHADWPGSRDSRGDCTGRHVQQQALVRLRRGLRVSSGGKNPEV